MNIYFLGFALAVYITYIAVISKRYLHMLQLNSYMYSKYLRWYSKNFASEITVFSVLPAVSALLAAYGQYLAFAAVWLVIYSIFILTRRKTKEKKKFVFTNRIIRLCITTGILLAAISLCVLYVYNHYSSTAQAILLALAAMLGELKIFYPLLAKTINTPVEKLVNLYFYLDAKRILRQNKKLIIIGITGSYGKTSSKYIISRILSARYNVLMTPESYNTLMGVVITIRKHLKSTHEVFVVEMGAYKRGEIAEICRLVQPQYGLLTTIGPQHLDTFKSIDNIILAKYELVEAVKDGAAFLNFENEFIRERKSSGKYFSYGINNSSLSYWAENIKNDSRGSSFTFCTYNHVKIELKTQLLGSHNVLNIVAACAAALELGVKPDDICYAVRQIPPVPHRLELKGSPSGVSIIDDAFNSNPVGANEALNVLGGFDSPMRILITPGMIELSEREYEYNYKFGVKAASSCDFIIPVGIKRAKPILDGIRSCNYSEDKIYVARNLNEALEKMKAIAIPGSVVLFENDLPDNYEE